MALSCTLIGAILAVSCLVALSYILLPETNEKLEWRKFRQALPAVDIETKSPGFFTFGASIRSVFGSAEFLRSGYNNFTKQGLPFALPNLANRAIVVLPLANFDLWNKPECQISAFSAQLNTLQPRYTFGGDPETYLNTVHFKVVRNKLFKNLKLLAPITAVEIGAAFTQEWGTPKEWKTINVWETCGKVFARTANRAFFGLPLCRDPLLLEYTRQYAVAVYGGATLINALPRWIQPVVGVVVRLVSKHYLTRCKKILIPSVEKRLRALKDQSAANPNDVLQWLIEECSKEDPLLLNPSHITQRLLVLNLVSIYTTTIMFANCLLDLSHSDARAEFLHGLRDECNQVSKVYGGMQEKEAVDRLKRADSTIRESMRMSCPEVTSSLRVVGTQRALGNGFHLPKGVLIGMPALAVHNDPRFYNEPSRFDAFRFSKPQEDAYDPRSRVDETGQEICSSVTKSFLAWGYGRHACTGRWFASQTMKQALAHVVQNYDMDVAGKRADKNYLLNFATPPVGAQLRIRQL